MKKKETLGLFSGEVEFWLPDGPSLQKCKMQPQVGYYITPSQNHRLITITDCVVFEASEPEKGITVRVEDDFARSNEDDELREDPNRGWKV